jgi:16S rRNA processing protein RimM
MSAATQEKILVGRFGAPHGLRGAIKVISWTEPIHNIFNYHPWYICQNGVWQVLKPTLCSKGEKLIATFEQSQDRDHAQSYTHTEIYIEKKQLKKLTSDQYYWSELAGMEVITQCQTNLGKVASVFNTGANDILAVQGERERLLPYVNDTIIDISKKNNTILVNWDPNF